jgi:integrase/recombinase XerD
MQAQRSEVPSLPGKDLELTKNGGVLRSFMTHLQSLATLQDGFEAFSLYARVEGRSPKTLLTYQRAFRDLLEFLGNNEKLLASLNAGIFRSWIAQRLDEGYSKVTINIRLRSLQAFFNWLVREGHLIESPLKQVKQLRVPRQYPYVLSEIQMQTLLRAVERTTWTGQRNWAMLLTFLDGMLRLSELINLELGDVNLVTRSIRVRHGKGEKERVVFMGKRLTKALQEWMQVRGHHVGEDRLFITRNGSKLDSRNVLRIIERLANKARIEGVRCSPHTLRHTGATLFIRYGGDAFSLQNLLGHSDISTTMIYVHMAGTALREAHAKASPADRLLDT